MARKPRADGTNFAREAAAELARPLPEPPLPLSPRAEKYWSRIIGAKLQSLWTDTDLDTAWGLCEDLGKLEELRQTLQRTPVLFKDDKGKIQENPVSELIEKYERRIQATKRHLQINSAAVNGASRDLAGKNEAARNIASAIDDADDLIARPKLRAVQ